MSTLRNEIDIAIEESSRKLELMADPPVKRWLLGYVLEKDSSDPVLQRTLEECETFPPRVKLLSSVRQDGTWPISRQRKAIEDLGPGPPYGWTYITMLRNLYMAYEYCVPHDNPIVQKPLDRILGWQTEEGYIAGPDLDRIPRPHYNGLAMGVLCRFERRKHPKVLRMVDWLMRMQRHDGGWNMPLLQDMRYRPEFRYLSMPKFLEAIREGAGESYDPADYVDVPSCVWSTLGAIRGLVWIPTHARGREVRRGGDFILDNFFKSNYHANFKKSPGNWTVLKFPTYHGSGLTALDCLVYMRFGPEDPRMEKAIGWLVGARSKDGLWHRSERPHPVDDQLITVTALTLLHYFRKMY